VKMDTINRVIGEIDDDIIEMAENISKVKPHKASWVKWGSIAVALVIILSVVYIFVSVLIIMLLGKNLKRNRSLIIMLLGKYLKRNRSRIIMLLVKYPNRNQSLVR
jgi:hypothetical protein